MTRTGHFALRFIPRRVDSTEVTAALLSDTGAIVLGATLLALVLATRVRGLRRVLLPGAVVVCLVGGAVAAGAPAARSAPDAKSATPVDGQLVAGINAFRASSGLPPLNQSPALTALA